MPEPNDQSGWVGAVLVFSFLAILATSIGMPDRIATHFAADGTPNGFMTRSAYLIVMGAVAVGIPALILYSLRRAMRRALGSDSINIPNRAYWLAPERRDASVAWLVGHAARLAAGVSVFAFILHLVLKRTNQLVPPRLDPATAMALLALSLCGVLAWAVGLVRHFRRP